MVEHGIDYTTNGDNSSGLIGTGAPGNRRATAFPERVAPLFLVQKTRVAPNFSIAGAATHEQVQHVATNKFSGWKILIGNSCFFLYKIKI